jgi:O-acetyl-ADP-ribose deacetylase (regulator of RNase III)
VGPFGRRAGQGADDRMARRMTLQSNYQRALKQFCDELDRLRADAGLSVDKLLSMSVQPELGLKRTQIYDVLAGRVTTPPSFDFIRALVNRCGRHAVSNQRGLSVSTDPAYWRYKLDVLESLHGINGWQEVVEALPLRGERGRSANVLTVQETFLRQISGAAWRLGVITGDIRHVRCAEIWVNSENTEMIMPRIQERSVSAIIRYEGAKRDAGGRVVDDIIADELESQAAGLRPVGAGEVIVTGSGELWHRNNVRSVIHAAAVYGEPGAGFRPINQIGRCVENALAAAEKLDTGAAADKTSILFPLLGVGEGGGDVWALARVLIHTAVNHMRTTADSRIGTVLFLAYTDLELEACQSALDEVKEFMPVAAKKKRERSDPRRR